RHLRLRGRSRSRSHLAVRGLEGGRHVNRNRGPRRKRGRFQVGQRRSACCERDARQPRDRQHGDSENKPPREELHGSLLRPAEARRYSWVVFTVEGPPALSASRMLSSDRPPASGTPTRILPSDTAGSYSSCRKDGSFDATSSEMTVVTMAPSMVISKMM